MPPVTVLVVDNEIEMRRTITSALELTDYVCTEAADASQASELLEKTKFDLVVCDLMVQGGGGLNLIGQIQANADGETAVLMVTAVDDPEVAHAAAALGSNGYLVKPFTTNELLINVDHALEGVMLRGVSALAQEHERRVKEVRGATMRLEREARAADRQAASLLWPLTEAVGLRDLETGAHIHRIGELSAMLAKASGMSTAAVEELRLAAPMHDIGKVAIPDSILLKPGRLDPQERAVVERHAKIGHDILAGSKSPLLDLAAEIAMTHHEWFDGTGYPQALSGDRIPITGRLVAIADVFDALTNDRPYRSAMTTDSAVELMATRRGTHFDPELLDLFFDRIDLARAISSPNRSRHEAAS